MRIASTKEMLHDLFAKISTNEGIVEIDADETGRLFEESLPLLLELRIPPNQDLVQSGNGVDRVRKFRKEMLRIQKNILVSHFKVKVRAGRLPCGS